MTKEKVYELLKEGLLPKQIAQREKISIQAVYKSIRKLKEKGNVIGSSYNGFQTQTTHKHIYKAIRLHGLEFNIKIRNPGEKYLKNEKSFILKGNRIRLFNKSIELYINQNFMGESAEQCLFKSIAYFKQFSFILQDYLNIRFKFVKLVNSHYSQLNNELAEDFNKKKEKLSIRTTEDNKIWAKIDFSLKENEFETIHPETSQADMDKVIIPFFNDLRNNPIPLPSIQYDLICKTIQIQQMFNENIVQHMEVLKEMSSTMRDIRKFIAKNR